MEKATDAYWALIYLSLQREIAFYSAINPHFYNEDELRVGAEVAIETCLRNTESILGNSNYRNRDLMEQTLRNDEVVLTTLKLILTHVCG